MGSVDYTQQDRILTHAYDDSLSLSFDMVREDAVKSKTQIAGLKVDIGNVDDKIGINNLMTTGVDMVVGAIEKEEKAEAEHAMKTFFQDYVRESEAKLVAKEEERERLMKQTFEENMKKMEEEHNAQLFVLTEKMQAEIAEERRLENEANEKIRQDMRASIQDLEVKTTVTEVLLCAVAQVEEGIRAEKVLAADKKLKEEKEVMEAELAEERRRAEELTDKFEQLSVIVNEREKLEGQEWARILDESSFVRGGGSGGDDDVTGKPTVVGQAKSSFPKQR